MGPAEVFMTSRSTLALSLLTTIAVASAPSTAQVIDQNFTGERLRPATTSAGINDVESGAVGEHLTWNVALWGGYALNPLVVYQGNDRVGSLIAHRVGGNLVASVALFDWVEIFADLPMVAFQTADAGGEETLGAPLAAVGLSDLRLAPKIRLLRAKEQFLDLAIIPAFTVPTGLPAGESFMGEGQLTFIPEVAASKQFDDGAIAGLKVAANAAYRLRPESRSALGTEIGSELVGRFGVGYRLHETVNLPLELDVSVATTTSALAPFQSGDVTPIEVLLGAKADVLRLKAAAGAGDGFGVQLFGGVGSSPSAGFGSPDLRVFVGLRGEKLPDIDGDDDFIADKDDQCPDAPEDKDGFEDDDGCPDTDNDGDDRPDVVDNCPNEAEDQDGFEDDDGCPDLDNDGDGILDNDDSCANESGPSENKGCPWPDADKDGTLDKDDACVDVAGLAALKGCPDGDGDGVPDGEDACPALAGPKSPYDGCPDTDGDGFTDDKDKCPNEPETVNNVDDDDGCPDEGKVLVKLTKDKIEILDMVFFASGTAVIQEQSFGLLDQVATVLRTHRELKTVHVEGHTDDQGADDTNMLLSQQRADAVKDYLISKGIEAARLVAEGFGETRPAVEGTTRAARDANRRVEFVLPHQKEAAATTSPAPTSTETPAVDGDDLK